MRISSLDVKALMDFVSVASKEIDLILIGVEPRNAAIQARRWFDIKRRKEDADKSGR